MNIRHLTTSLAALACMIGASASADEIYKWTDENGNVHYEDRPSGQPTEQRLDFSYSRTSRSAVQSRVENQRERAAAQQDARAEKEQEKRTAAEERAAAEEKLAQCQTYRAKLKTILESRRLYRENDAGDRVYLDEVARAEARQKAESLVKETCDG